jgi:hypothetical protein
MHDNELDISPDVVQTLVERQFPQWRSLPVRHVGRSPVPAAAATCTITTSGWKRASSAARGCST